MVVDHRILSSVVLLDSVTNALTDGGPNIPTDHLVANPRRSKLGFAVDELSEVRSLGRKGIVPS